MKINDGFKMREVCGEHIIVAEGETNINFSKIISLNETAACVWKAVESATDFSVEDMAAVLTAEYDVDAETALNDCKELVNLWEKEGIISIA